MLTFQPAGARRGLSVQQIDYCGWGSVRHSAGRLGPDWVWGKRTQCLRHTHAKKPVRIGSGERSGSSCHNFGQNSPVWSKSTLAPARGGHPSAVAPARSESLNSTGARCTHHRPRDRDRSPGPGGAKRASAQNPIGVCAPAAHCETIHTRSPACGLGPSARPGCAGGCVPFSHGERVADAPPTAQLQRRPNLAMLIPSPSRQPARENTHNASCPRFMTSRGRLSLHWPAISPPVAAEAPRPTSRSSPALSPRLPWCSPPPRR